MLSTWEAMLELFRIAFPITVVDAGFCLEEDEELLYDQVRLRRNAVTRLAVEQADLIVAVARADPVGLHAFIRGYQDLRDLGVPASRVRVVVNQLRPGMFGGDRPGDQVRAALRRYVGVEPVALVPYDRAGVDAALLAGQALREARPGCPAQVALARLAARLFPRPGRPVPACPSTVPPSGQDSRHQGVGTMTTAAHQTADQIVEVEVRELVRRRGLDPGNGDAGAVRQLIDEVVADYAERRLVANMPPLADAGQVTKAVADRVIGMGPLQPFFDDPEVEEIWINEPGKVFVAKAGRPQLTTTVLGEQDVHDLVELMLRASGRRVDLSSPFVDATMSDGSRLHVVIPDITRRHWAVNIRRFVLRAHSLAELVRLGTLSSQCARFLEAAVVSGLNIVVAGATQSGKTTTLNCLAAAIPPRERVITCEEVFELQVGLPDTVAMQTRQPNLEGEGEIRQRRLIKEALRMRPDRLIVGEVRQEECLDLLIAFNSGIPGMTSVHANSAREALVKLTTLPLLAGENVSHRFILPTVAATIDLIVFLRGDGWGHRRVEEVLAVSGRVEEDQVEAGLVFRRAGDRLLWTGEYPPHAERFRRHGFELVEVLAT